MSEFTKPINVRLGDGTWWELVDSTEYYVDEYRTEVISVPAGFITNFASIPKVFRPFIEDKCIYNHAAVIHDYLYTYPTKYSRKEADKIFYDGLLVLGIDIYLAKLFYWSVRLFGWKCYNRNLTAS